MVLADAAVADMRACVAAPGLGGVAFTRTVRRVGAGARMLAAVRAG